MEDFTPETDGSEGVEFIEPETSNDPLTLEDPEALEEYFSLVSLPNGETLRVDHSADLGDLLIALLLFTLLVLHAFKWVGESLRERRGD